MYTVLILCMSTFLSFNHFACARSPIPDSEEYGIIVDAGSSSSKLKVYSWERGAHAMSANGTNPATQQHDLKLIHDVKFSPGVSSLVYALDKVPGYMNPILQEAKARIPIYKHATTSIQFMATAGLRIFPINDTESLLDAVSRYLHDVTYNPFFVPQGSVRVISGEEEGVYAWVVANYLRGFFWSDSHESDAVGVLEMGGGSTQIAFLPDFSLYANMFPVSVGGKLYRLYAHSYLFYGQNYITDRINEHLMNMAPASTNIYNPCLLTGDNMTRSMPDRTVRISGSGNTAQCLEIIQQFIQAVDDTYCYPKACAIGSVYQPPVGDIVFYATAAFTFAPTYLKAVDDYGRLNLTLLKKNADLHCRKPLNEVTAGGLSASFASSYCIMGLYIPSLLIDAYGFSAERNVVYVKANVENVTIDWAMGAMLLYMDNTMVENIVITDDCDDKVLHSSGPIASSTALRTNLGIVFFTAIIYLIFS